MCGIFGWSFKRKARICAGQREALATTLGVANSLRGDQSWGCFFLDHGGKARTRREVGDIADVTGLGSLGMWDLFMAHTRYATVGRVCRDNQHPFQVGHVLLAHNGVVFNHDELNEKYGRACSVDSQHFAHHLAEKRDFSDVEAYGAIEWIEDADKGAASQTVNLCRMRRGQLAVWGIRNSKGKQVGTAWSSDVEHLRSAIGAARLDAFPYKKLDEGCVYTVQGGRLYTSERRLACVEPTWDPQAWTTYRSTQTGGRGHSTPLSREASRSLAEWMEKRQAEENAAALFRGTSDAIEQIDVGLYVDTRTGEMVDRPGAEEDLTVREGPEIEPCETCGSLVGCDDNGDCRECFTPRETRIADMTDAQLTRHLERMN